MSERSKVTISSFNTQGLGDTVKRKLVFDWLKNTHRGIVLLQETHSTEETESIWKSEWDGEIFFSHGTSQKCGVAILLTPDVNAKVQNRYTDEEGRVILIDIDLPDHHLVLCNVYAPTKDKAMMQEHFLTSLKELLTPYADRDILVGGDFNICQNPELDKKGGTLESASRAAKNLVSLKEELQLIDIWRLRHPTLRRYTRRERSLGGFVQSRLDFWLVSNHLEYSIGKLGIEPGRRSDHSIVYLQLELVESFKRGKGFWKFNTSLLKDEDYVTKINSCIEQCKDKYKYLEDKRLAWDVTKCEIRAETISYACFKAKQRRKLESELTDRKMTLEPLIAEHPNEDNLTEYQTVTSELDNLNLISNDAVKSEMD